MKDSYKKYLKIGMYMFSIAFAFVLGNYVGSEEQKSKNKIILQKREEDYMRCISDNILYEEAIKNYEKNMVEVAKIMNYFKNNLKEVAVQKKDSSKLEKVLENSN